MKIIMNYKKNKISMINNMVMIWMLILQMIQWNKNQNA